MHKPKKILDEIQSAVHKGLLKSIGFKKSGRTFNRISDDGLIEIINFQSGQYQFNHVQEIPSLRENLYGNFTINLGINIPEYYQHRFNKTKKFYQEYDCSIRTRIGSIIGNGDDLWWELKLKYRDNQIRRVIELLKNFGLVWLEELNSREKIYNNWERIANKYNLSNTAKLNIATIKILNNDKIGEKLFNEYYKLTEKSIHKEWLKDEASKLRIKIST